MASALFCESASFAPDCHLHLYTHTSLNFSSQLSTDEVYLMAVQNIVRLHVSHTTNITTTGAVRDKSKPTSVRSWTVSEASLHMLEEVQHLLSCVQNCEMALACANWVVKELPMGKWLLGTGFHLDGPSTVTAGLPMDEWLLGTGYVSDWPAPALTGLPMDKWVCQNKCKMAFSCAKVGTRWLPPTPLK